MGKKLLFFLVSFCTVVFMTGCSQLRYMGSVPEESQTRIRILSGSENQELEEIIEECASQSDVQIEMDYKGSVDIMRELETGAENYDAVWPASSIWLSMGDQQHMVKHEASVSMTPVVFGIRRSLAEDLGFIGKDVSVKDILEAIRQGKMSFCMTSATQSNSGASAYIGFLYAMLGKQENMTVEDLNSEQLKSQVKELLNGVERSSGSSDWLKELFLEEDYDAMVNYECLMIDANKKLMEEGKEPLQIIYPYDGLSIADSPLGYVDHGDAQKEEAFLRFQETLLSDEIQSQIESTGRRIRADGVSEKNQSVFDSAWGIDTERILSPIRMPDGEVLMQALSLYQTELKKPSLNLYCLDFSDSMAAVGLDQLKDAMSQILIQDNARKNLLQATEGEINIAILFDDGILDILRADDISDESMQNLYDRIASYDTSGGTDIYNAAARALEEASKYPVEEYTPAIILMTDGKSSYHPEYFDQAWERYGLDIPIFSITFGSADEKQLEELAEKTEGKVFDGTKDLTEAFRSVKGYN